MILSKVIKPIISNSFQVLKKRKFSTFNPNTREKRFNNLLLNITVIGGVLYWIFDE